MLRALIVLGAWWAITLIDQKLGAGVATGCGVAAAVDQIAEARRRR